MKKKNMRIYIRGCTWVALFIAVFSFSVLAQVIPSDSLYLGQAPPNNTAVLFAKDIVSANNLHGRILISPDGKEIFWTTLDTSTFATQIKHAAFINGKWSPADVPSFALSGITANPVYSPDGQKLFLNYRTNMSANWVIRYVEKLDDTTWSGLKSNGFLLNPSSSFTNNGKVYYSDYKQGKPWQTAIYSANYSNSGFSGILLLDQTINSTCIDYTPFISADDSYILFSSSRPVQNEVMYIFISFKKNGVWTTPQKINEAVGFTGNARFPVVSADGKYLFFCGDDFNMYWVNINSVLQLNPVKIEKYGSAYKHYELFQNFPNPFNPSTKISYSIPEREFVLLKVYDLLGSSISTLVASVKEAGYYSVDFNCLNLPNGVYYYRITAGCFSQTRKMILMK